mgnify:CR=1 FL=1
MNAQVKKEETKKEVLPVNKTSVETWTMVQEVANSEIKANGKMLYIFKNFMKMYENNKNTENLVENLEKLNDLYKSGVLTKEEFEKAKKRILN